MLSSAPESAPAKPPLLGHQAGSRQEACPCRASQRATDADAPDAEVGEILLHQITVPADQHVHRLGRHRLDHGADRHLYAGRTRFIDDETAKMLEQRVWPQEQGALAPQTSTAQAQPVMQVRRRAGAV